MASEWADEALQDRAVVMAQNRSLAFTAFVLNIVGCFFLVGGLICFPLNMPISGVAGALAFAVSSLADRRLAGHIAEEADARKMTTERVWANLNRFMGLGLAVLSALTTMGIGCFVGAVWMIATLD